LPTGEAASRPLRADSTGWPAAVLDRALGAYLGLALGDALGATVEFLTAREIVHHHGVHRDIVGGGWLKLPRGAVTDDTTMSLALGQALVDGGGWSLPAVADAFVAWLRGKPVDCGNTCRRGIQRYIDDGSFHGPLNDGDGGNGALMRNLPVVLASLADEAALAERSVLQARLTHHHPQSDAATLAFARMTRALLLDAPPAAVAQIAQELVRLHPAFRFDPYPGRASAYVVDTAQTVLHHYFAHDDFESCLVATVNRGGDADTTGALAGMLAGARCGAQALPARWVDALDPHVAARIRAQTVALLALAGAAR
jgi:ADP-ribosyl-[dinitrogen reductase] hydrolase